jgi:AraC-like DNA-binding protein
MATEQYPKIYLYKRIVQAKLFIDNNYAEDIDLDNIADEAYFSKFHFIRLFKNIYGSTPHHYLRQVRIENAKQLLAKNISASQVCFLVGFDSVSSFTGLFKKITGFTPSAYQLMQRKRRSAIATNPLDFVPACYAHQTGWL